MIAHRSFLGTVAAPSIAAACTAPDVHRLLQQAQRDQRSPAEIDRFVAAMDAVARGRVEI